eukprot:scaffold47260_cov28-Tisochrysis_lutea.AAC.3
MTRGRGRGRMLWSWSDGEGWVESWGGKSACRPRGRRSQEQQPSWESKARHTRTDSGRKRTPGGALQPDGGEEGEESLRAHLVDREDHISKCDECRLGLDGRAGARVAHERPRGAEPSDIHIRNHRVKAGEEDLPDEELLDEAHPKECAGLVTVVGCRRT